MSYLSTALSRSLILAAIAGAAIVPAKASITFNISYDSSVTGLTDYTNGNIPNAVNYVAGEFSSLFTDAITINITVAGMNSGLGQSNTQLQGTTYGAILGALQTDSKTTNDASFVAALPGADPITTTHAWWIPTAEAKALGLLSGTAIGSDGTYSFNDTTSYTYDPNNRGASSKYDFIGVTEHEFSEIMGRIPGLGGSIGGTPSYLPDDLTRFTANNVRDYSGACNSYLSANNGASNLAGFNCVPGDDLQDYDGTVATDPFNASTSSGQAHALTNADLVNLDIIGYDLNNTPEPSTFILVGGVLLGAGFLRRKQL